jgi:acylpyruvate hydrolase
MQLATLQTVVGQHPGVVVGAEILDLVLCASVIPAARLLPPSMRLILAAQTEGLDLVRRIADRVRNSGSEADRLRELGALVDRGAAKLLAPIPDPALVQSCGTNYGAHMKEMGGKAPSASAGFIKCSGSIIGTGAAIVLPRSNPNLVDYEGEFSVVIGRPCHQVTEAEAMDYVAGYTLVNDVSARDWVRDMQTCAAAGDVTGFNQASLYNISGKNFPTFCPMGPVVTTCDEIPDPHAITFRTLLNGEQVQWGSTDDLIFGIPWLLAEYSKFYRFQPGDVLTTGSPSGVGMGRKPPRLLRPGDVIEIESEKIGVLSNTVIAG